LGQNSGIIAQLQALYAEMWAQDANALYTYAGQMATITKTTPFQNAPQVASQDAPAKLTASTAAATANSSAGNAQNTVSKALTTLSAPTTAAAPAVKGITDPTNGFLSEIWFLLTGQTLFPSNLGALINGYAPYAGFFYNTEGLPYFSVGMANSFVQVSKAAGILGGAAPAAAKAATGAAQGLGGLGAALGGGAGPVAAGLGGGAHVAGLSVPASWPGAVAPSVAKPISAVPVSEVITAPESSGAGNLVGGVPAAGVGGAGRGAGAGPRYGFKPTVMARPLSAG
jgi:PPE-repeat protein